MDERYKTLRLIFLAALFGIFCTGLANAEIYKWIDANGKVQFSDQKPDDTTPETVELEINSLSFPKVETNNAVALGRREVVMYSTTWCGYCKKARKFFRSKGIRFKEYDVEKSHKGKKDYARLNGRGVPIILVGNQRMNGFDADRFMSLYRK
jgi:glutaredoxin